MTRQEKLQEAQRVYRVKLQERKPLETEYKVALKRLQRHNQKLKALGQAIYDLKHNGDTPEVTDHAVVRYLERVKGYDILDLKAEVANHAQASKVGNVIVTVNEVEPE